MDAFGSRRLPWDIVPPLKRQSLRVMGTILFECRNRAASDVSHMWDRGLTSWSLGTVAYDYTLLAVNRAAASGDFPWLSILDKSSHFVFGVHGVPFRFYRGQPDEAASYRHATGCGLERAQLELAGLIQESESDSMPCVFRFVISTDLKGYATGVTFARVTEIDGVLHDTWPVPRLQPSAVAVAFKPTVSIQLIHQQPTETMPKPVFGRSKSDKEQKADETKGA